MMSAMMSKWLGSKETFSVEVILDTQGRGEHWMKIQNSDCSEQLSIMGLSLDEIRRFAGSILSQLDEIESQMGGDRAEVAADQPTF